MTSLLDSLKVMIKAAVNFKRIRCLALFLNTLIVYSDDQNNASKPPDLYLMIGYRKSLS